MKLRNSVKYSYNNSPFYHELFKEYALRPNNVKSFEDISKIPFTSSDDLKNPEKFFAVPKSNFVKIFSSSGTTGKPKRIYFTKKDLERQISGLTTGMNLLYDMHQVDRVRLTYDHGYGMDDWGVRYCLENAIENLGAIGVITSSHLPADQEFQLLNTYSISMIMGTPSYIHSISCDMKKLYELSNLNIKKIMVGTEPLPKSIRKKLEKIWNTDVFQGYGLTEMCTSVAGECKEKDGMHLTESDFYAEVIDPKSGDILEDEEVGEIVFTTLSREGMPLIRYRTHDLGLIISDKCPCGLPFRRIKVKGRTDKMITIGSGDNIYPNAFDRVLFSIPSVINYQIILDRKNNKDHVTTIVETNSIDDNTKKEIAAAIMKLPEIYNGVRKSKTIEKIEIQLVKPHTLDMRSVKARRLIDNRNIYE
jgi:phenylacetate-CoA ligase